MLCRPASTRVQFLIGLLIVVLAAGLFVGLVGRARESADRTRCANNLKQLGLAVQNYHDVNDNLPPLVDQGEGAPTGHGLPSMFAMLMPFIESDPWNYYMGRTSQQYLSHSSVAFTFDSKGETITEHGGIANQFRKVFVCPADDSAHELCDVAMTLPDGSTGNYATGSYAANGLAPWGTGTTPKSFPRGMENTVLLAERPQVCQRTDGTTIYNLWGLGFYSPHMPAFATLTPEGHPDWLSTEQVAPVLPLPAEAGDVSIRVGRTDAGPQQPDFATPFQRARRGRACDPRLPGSMHRDGIAVLMADGSTRMFDWDMSPWAFWRACVPTGGE